MKNVITGILSILLLTAATPASLLAQQNQQQNTNAALEVEKLRLQAQERERTEAEQRNWETRIFPIRYVDANELGRILSMFRAQSSPNNSLRVITVRAPKEIMPAIEDAIKRLDVPTPTISRSADLTIYVLMASDQAEPTNIPTGLQSVVNQLRGVLTYKSYQLIDTLLARGSNDRNVNLSGSLTGVRPGETEATFYTLQGQFRIDNSDGKTPMLQVRNMQFSMTGQGRSFENGVRIATEVEIPQGQQVVVGKATMGDRAIILVMSAKFSN